MENNKTLVRKRTRIPHKVDLSLIRAALLNRLEAACHNSRDPVRVLSIGGNIYIEDGQIVVHMNIELEPKQLGYNFEYDEINIPIKANEFIKFKYVKDTKYDHIEMDAALLDDQLGFYMDKEFKTYPVAREINFEFYTGITEGF